MTQTAFTVFCALGIAGILLPAGWFWKNRNWSVIAFTFWSLCCLLPGFVNSIVWRDNVRIVAPVWCDICTKLMIGAEIGIACADFCNSRYLYQVLSMKIVSTTKRNRAIFDISLCFGFPVLIMILHVIVQGHRFNLVEGFGCQPAIYWSIPALFILNLPILSFSVGAAVYSGFTIKHMISQRRSFSQLLSASSSALTTSRFIRLMCLTSFIFIFTIPVQVFFLYSNLHELGGFQPWTSWDDVHSNFGSIAQIPEWALALASPTLVHANFLSFWMFPLTGLVFFFFFGVFNESLRPSIISFLRRMGFKIATSDNTLVGSGSSSTSKFRTTQITLSGSPNLSPGASFQSGKATEKDIEKDAGQESGCGSDLDYVEECPPIRAVAQKESANI